MSAYAKFYLDLCRREDLSVYAKNVFTILNNFARRTGEAWPSIRRICLMLNFSENAVRRALRDLVAAGLITLSRTVGCLQVWVVNAFKESTDAGGPSEGPPPPSEGPYEELQKREFGSVSVKGTDHTSSGKGEGDAFKKVEEDFLNDPPKPNRGNLPQFTREEQLHRLKHETAQPLAPVEWVKRGAAMILAIMGLTSEKDICTQHRPMEVNFEKVVWLPNRDKYLLDWSARAKRIRYQLGARTPIKLLQHEINETIGQVVHKRPEVLV